jgi:hypothetical protein
MQTVIPALSQLGYDVTNALRMALRDMGYDPNYLLIKEETPAIPEGMEQGGLPAPEATPEMTPELLDLMAQQAQVPAPAPAQAVAEEFGGPGVPGATTGTVAL